MDAAVPCIPDPVQIRSLLGIHAPRALSPVIPRPQYQFLKQTSGRLAGTSVYVRIPDIVGRFRVSAELAKFLILAIRAYLISGGGGYYAMPFTCDFRRRGSVRRQFDCRPKSNSSRGQLLL
jgi:hypothetical protein